MARLLAQRGAVVVDADALAREALRPDSPGLRAVVERFGTAVLGPDGGLDRAALARLVFSHPDRLAALERIVHPYVRRRSAQLAASADPAAVVVHDVPLLVETSRQHDYDVVVVVDAPDEVRLRRLVQTRGMPAADARARMAAQAGRAQRLAAADHVVVNDGDLAHLAGQVDRLWRLLLAAGHPTRSEPDDLSGG